jgi:hypothetical protein
MEGGSLEEAKGADVSEFRRYEKRPTLPEQEKCENTTSKNSFGRSLRGLFYSI